MKNLTIKEKKILINCIECYIEEYERTNLDRTEEYSVYKFNRIRELRKKLILDVYPIVIDYNNTASKCECSLCGNTFRAGVPEWAFLDTGQFDPICDNCFKIYLPEEFEKINERNKTLSQLLDQLLIPVKSPAGM